MFNNNAQRNFEWFEASFTKKIQQIIYESNQDNASWIRDFFISILLAILPLACELIMNQQQQSQQAAITNNQQATLPTSASHIVQLICTYATIISLIGLVIWVIHCIWKYNKAVQKFKKRIIPHTIKGKYSIEESVHYFDNDVCNDLILSKHYLSLASSEENNAAKEFYLIEALHYYYKSIRIFNIICNSHATKDLQQLFVCNHSGTDKRIDVVRLINYLALIKSISIVVNSNDDPSIYQGALDYNESFSLIVSNLNSTYTTLQNHFPTVSQFATENPELIQITKDIRERIASKKPTTI